VTRELIEYVAKSLVDHPEEINLSELEEDGIIVYQLRVAPKDIGKVIGRRGRVARSMRTLLKVASIQNRRRTILEIE
jgi:predicted RNA-binding protein YlqC (UPF0109 family)